jgi:glutamate:GABA antiporter
VDVSTHAAAMAANKPRPRVRTAGVTMAAILGLDVGKWVQNIGGVAILAVFAVLILLPLWGLARHQPIHWSPFSFAAPPRDLRTFALFGQIMFGGLCGLEYVAILAGESRQPARTIGQSVWIASPIICAMFILGTSTLVAYVPQGSIDFIAPIPQAMRAALGADRHRQSDRDDCDFPDRAAPAGCSKHDLHRRHAPAHDRWLG